MLSTDFFLSTEDQGDLADKCVIIIYVFFLIVD